MVKEIGEYCKQFRMNTLNIPLSTLCRVYGDSVKNVSAFENGRANNIKYLLYYMYYDLQHINTFLRGLNCYVNEISK